MEGHIAKYFVFFKEHAILNKIFAILFKFIFNEKHFLILEETSKLGCFFLLLVNTT